MTSAAPRSDANDLGPGHPGGRELPNPTDDYLLDPHQSMEERVRV